MSLQDKDRTIEASRSSQRDRAIQRGIVAHLTLKRAGTFIYHTHLNDLYQISTGLYGPIIVLEPGQRCASTSNRNFEGRQGRGGRTHLVGPAMAAAAAIRGQFTDVRTWDFR